jgi:hypothetical protein
MSKTMATLFLVGSLALAAGPALAGQPGGQPATAQTQKARLESGLHQLAMQETTSPKMGAVKRADIARQQAEIKNLIHQLESGQTVAPSAVDHALQPR